MGSLTSADLLPAGSWPAGRRFTRRLAAGGALVLHATAMAPLVVPAALGAQALKWYKGNTHTHTLNSDGDSSPDEVARWYREHGYHFLVLTDHNFLTSVDGLNALMGADEQFLILPGEEVTDRFGTAPLHINGLLVERKVDPQGGQSVSDVIQRDVNAIRAVNGVPHINHPNFGWAVTAADIKRVQNDRLFEIWNGHPLVNNDGGGDSPGLEAMWDDILSSGKLLYGIAVDDAHHFKRPFDPSASQPGKGWVYVRAPRLDGREIVAALERGDFYASTGVELADVQFAAGRLTVTVKDERACSPRQPERAGPPQPSRPAAACLGSKYRIRFIGRNGTTLKEVPGTSASYDVRGDEGYVRAVVYESNGKRAWVQPVMVGREATERRREG